MSPELQQLQKQCEAYIDKYPVVGDVFQEVTSYGTFSVRCRNDRHHPVFQRLLSLCHIDLEACKFIYVIGTSGKGSMVTEVHMRLHSAGNKVASYVSPHILEMDERYRVGDGLWDEELLLEAGAEVLSAVAVLDSEGVHVLYGDILFFIFLLLCKKSHVDIAVVEVGCGARYHITNKIPFDIVVHTGVSSDHLGSMGPTLRDVAFHDAGALKQGRVMLSSMDNPDFQDMFMTEAKDVGAECRFVPASGLCFAALEEASRRWGVAYDTGAYVSPSWFPGRLQVFHTVGKPHVLIDSAHNPEKIAYLSAFVKEYVAKNGVEHVSVVFSTLAGKDIGGMVQPLLPLVDTWYATSVQDVKGKKFYTPMEMMHELQHHTYPPAVHMVGDPLKAFDQACRECGPHDLVIVTGSMYMIGKILEKVKGE